MVFLLMGGAYLRSRIKQAGKWDQETIVSFFLCQYCSGEYLRDDAIQRANQQPAFSQDLFEQVLQRDNILAAWHRVRANKGAPGVDGMTIEAFPAWARSGHWKRTATELRVGQYHPAPVRRVEIDKPDGGKRQLGIPTVTDRVIQQ